MVKSRLSNVIVEGSDSLYKFELGKIEVNFWSGNVKLSNLHISIDSNRYQQMKDARNLPPLTMDLSLPEANISGLKVWKLIFYKEIEIREIDLLAADVKLARHFRTTDTISSNDEPLWKLIQPDIKKISIDNIICANLKVNYQNVDSAKSFRWQLDKCNFIVTNVKVDSVSAKDSTRLLFSKNIALAADDMKLKTPDGLYNLAAKKIQYSSSVGKMELKDFTFLPAVSEGEIKNYFGIQHEIYKIKVPVLTFHNFLLPQWISNNKLQIDTVTLASPSIALELDRNMPANVKSKKGGYPNQLLQKAPFVIKVKRMNVTNATLSYSEKSNTTGLTGKIVFPSLRGTLDNITNDRAAIAQSAQCIVRINGSVIKTGTINAVFNFSLTDKKGAFTVQSTVTNLTAAQLQPIFRPMTGVDLQSFNMKRLDYTINGNEDRGTGDLQMKYDEMDILINKVSADKKMEKKGLLSFVANRLLIYKENPSKDGEERKAHGITVQRDATRSFFNLVWKTLFTASGEIVLRPLAQKRIEKSKQKKR
ncbi:MAG: hypothetical protein ABIP79_15605 [Chitinophagaceae bacterium]